jgi:alpha,alpha-trehalase
MLDFTAYEPLFSEIQLSGYFADSKTFPDCIPLRPLADLNADFVKNKENVNFEIGIFIEENFEFPISPTVNFEVNAKDTPAQHATRLWEALTRQTEILADSTLIPLPQKFVVPGGRFGEIYYWDSYFTMLGLRVSKREDLIKAMLDNFSYLISTFGFVPNGNRTYFLSRSQPPFFSLMVALLAEIKGQKLIENYIESIEKEYDFWMKGHESLKIGEACERVYCQAEGVFLNRYFDNDPRPRPESFKEDVELAQKSSQSAINLYTNLRAACESGWDFSSRWLTDPDDLGTIHTTDLLAVDLNCLIWHSENMLGIFYESKDIEKAQKYQKRANSRKTAINTLFWNEKTASYADYDFVKKAVKNQITAASAYPLFFNLSNQIQAQNTSEAIENELLSFGGILTTKIASGQQWDAPNGWAPLQWMTYKGLLNYEFKYLANTIKQRWMNANESFFANEHKFTEKYDVSKSGENAAGGEYPNQDGFGWTNGVYLAFTAE